MIRERNGLAPASGMGNGKRSMLDEDFSRLSELGVTNFRTSIEWSRIEPQKGVYNREAIEECRAMMETAERRGIKLWMTLHNVTLPAWFARLGGFMDEAALLYWHRYVELVAKELGRHADYWIPIHQPVAYAAGAYLLGLYPPAKRRMDKFQELLVKIHRIHGDAYRILKTYLPSQAKVGMAARIVPVHPADPESDQHRASAEFLDTLINRLSLDVLKEGVICVPGMGAAELPSCEGAADFFGIDYFFRLVAGRDAAGRDYNVLAGLAEVEGMPGVSDFQEGDVITELGWGAYPAGIYESIKRVHQAGLDLPIYVTASGVATTDEDFRVQYLGQCIKQVHEAIEQGLDVRGYFHYTDVDAYEWNKGFDAHYGLYGFDPASMKRIERPAAKFFSSVALNNKLPGPVNGKDTS